MKFKKYKIRTVFDATTCSIEMSKEDEKELKRIIKEMDYLNKKLKVLFKKQEVQDNGNHI